MAPRARVVAVGSASGGVGKTLVASNLAIALQQQTGGRVLLVDAGHPIPGNTPAVMGLERAKSLGEMRSLLERLTPELFASYLVTARTGVSVLPLLSEPLEARLVGDDVVERLFALAGQAYSAVVVDMPAGVGTITPALLARTDSVCVVCDPSAQRLPLTRSLLEYYRSVQMPSDAVLICVNRATSDGNSDGSRVEQVLHHRVTIELPDDPDPVNQSLARGNPLIVWQPRHAISRGIDQLARHLLAARIREAADVQAAAAVVTDVEVRVQEVKARIHRRLVDEIEFQKSDLSYLRDPVKHQEVRTRAESKVLALIDEEARDIRSRELRKRIVKDVLDEALGLGPLQDFLADASITEIMVNRHNQIYVERAGRLELTTARFNSAEQVRAVIERIVAPIGRHVDEKTPMVDARLGDGSRVNAVIPPLALKGPVLTIRKFSLQRLGIDDLVRLGSLNEALSAFLGIAVRARQNIVISGGTGSGKTTLLNVLSSFVPATERIVTIEDSAELRLPQDHVVPLEARPSNMEGEGAITIRDLVRNALRMRPDRIVVGECRGGEALDMLQAMNTGHDGSLTTIHANTPRDALSRLETMSLMAGLDLPSRAIRDQIASAIQFVVQQTRLQDGSRRVTHVTEMVGLEGGEFVTHDIFVFRQTGIGPDGKVLGQFLPTGQVPKFVETLSQRGLSLPREIFLHQRA